MGKIFKPRHRRIYFSLPFTFALIFLNASCNSLETSSPLLDLGENETGFTESINEDQLIELSAYFASILTNPEVLKEFYGYSKLKGNEGELEFSIKKLFETEFDQISRKKSSIVSVFKGESLRTQSKGFDIDYYTDFIKKNDLEVLAPYLARRFSLEELDELTISWWTQEMQDEGLKKGSNWKGETPAFKIKLAEKKSFHSLINDFKENKLEVFMVSDDYAMENPTIIFGAFGEGLYERGYETNEISSGQDNLNWLNVIPSNVGITCNQVLPNDLVQYLMPEFRILDNTKGWPSGNYITIWVVYGEINETEGAIASTEIKVKRLVHKKKINRGDFKWKRNFVGQPLLPNWHDSNLATQIIIAYDRYGHTLTHSGTYVSANPNTGEITFSSQAITQEHTMMFGSQTWYRCAEINGAHKMDIGHGFQPNNPNSNAIWQFSGRDGRAQFTLEPRLSRL
jgi:hypothetical protein